VHNRIVLLYTVFSDDELRSLNLVSS